MRFSRKNSEGKKPLLSKTRYPVDLLVTYLKFSHFLCFTPYKILENQDGTYQLYKWLPQQIVSFALTLTALLIRLTELRSTWAATSWTPSQFIRVFYNFFNAVFNFVVIYSFWFQPQKLLRLIKFGSDIGCPSSKFAPKNRNCQKTIRKALIVVTTFCFTHASAAFCVVISGLGTISSTVSTWNPGYLIYCMQLKAKYTLFLQGQDGCTSLKEPLNPMPLSFELSEILFAVFGMLSAFFRQINGMYEELAILVASVAFWLHVNCFTEHLKDLHSSRDWPKVYECFTKIKMYCSRTNDAFSLLFLAYTMTSLFYYSINLDKFLTSSDIVMRIKYSVYYTNLFVIFIMASDVNRKLSVEMEKWISQHLEPDLLSTLTQSQLSLILHDISNNNLGISGYNIFTVTYATTAQMAGILITYFVITVQFGAVAQ